METIGEKLSPILLEIEGAILDSYHRHEPTKFTHEAFIATTHIFMTVLMDKMWQLQEKEGMPFDDRMQMVNSCGKEVRELVKKFTDIDTHDLLKK